MGQTDGRERRLRLPGPVGRLAWSGRPSRFLPSTLGSSLEKWGLEVIDIVPASVKVGHHERCGWPIGLDAKAAAVLARTIHRASFQQWNVASNVCACARKPLT